VINFKLNIKIKNRDGKDLLEIEPLTNEALEVMTNPSENLENVSKLLTWEEGIPYDSRSQEFDLSEFNLMPIEEEYLSFLHGL
jgi:hypothetical protein